MWYGQYSRLPELAIPNPQGHRLQIYIVILQIDQVPRSEHIVKHQAQHGVVFQVRSGIENRLDFFLIEEVWDLVADLHVRKGKLHAA